MKLASPGRSRRFVPGRSLHFVRAAALGACLSAFSACDGESTGTTTSGAGAVVFTTYGEEYIEQELPASEFEDGWSVRFEKFFIVLGDVSVGKEGASSPAAKMATPKLFSMTKPAGDKAVVAFPNLPGTAYTHVSYAVGPATAATEIAEGVTEADTQQMVQNGYSVYIEATASKDGATKKFAWGFKTNTLYDKCKGEVAGKETDGVVVTNGGTDNVQLTIHGDHFFYDDLQSPEAKVRFDNIAAADANDDGTVTLEELAAVQLATIPAEKGSYGTGSAAGVNDLRAFVESLSRTLGHFRGEGECIARAR